MKKLLLPLILTSLSGCHIAEQMNNQVNASTASIHANREAIERDTEAIRQNGATIQESNQALIENLELIEKMRKS